MRENPSSVHATETKTSAPDASRAPMFAMLSDTGLVRKENQDACGAFCDSGGNWLWVVADGMGGHKGGSTASRICVETIGRRFEKSPVSLEDGLKEAIAEANRAVLDTSRMDVALGGMGTTVVAFLLSGQRRGWVAWVGDSRAYRVRDGGIELLTEDHSLVAEWVRQRVITSEQAATHPRRNELLHCIGLDEHVPVALREVDVAPGDRILLCSDGLWGTLSEREIAEVAGRENVQAAVAVLVERANARGGPDNITVQLAAVPGRSSAAPVSTAALRAAPALRVWPTVALAAGVAVALACGIAWLLWSRVAA